MKEAARTKRKVEPESVEIDREDRETERPVGGVDEDHQRPAVLSVDQRPSHDAEQARGDGARDREIGDVKRRPRGHEDHPRESHLAEGKSADGGRPRRKEPGVVWVPRTRRGLPFFPEPSGEG